MNDDAYNSDIDTTSIDTDKFEQHDNMRLDSYTPPSQLKFPKELEEDFLSKGYKLRWVHNVPKQVRYRSTPAEGYTFVTADEVAEDQLVMLGDIGNYGETSVIVNGDLVLMKVRVEKNEARKQYYQNKTKQQSDAIDERLRQNAIDTGGSRSVVRTGKNAHFSSTV